MKKVIFGGMILIAGTIMFSIGTLGFANVSVQAHYMLLPQRLGVLIMVVGLILGFFGLKRD